MAVRDDFTPGEVLAAADLNDTFGTKANSASPTLTGTVTMTGSTVVGFRPAQGYLYHTTIYYTSSGTFTKATYPWLRAVRVRMVGGGGGSAGHAATGAGQVGEGGPGGGAGYSEKFITDIAGMSASVTVTVGAGGAGGAAGQNNGVQGGDSSAFGITGGGGGAGLSSTVNTPADIFPREGDAGTASGGDLLITGQNGLCTIALNVNRLIPGTGGGSVLGSMKQQPIADSSGRPSSVGRPYGGGATSPAVGQNGAAQAGAAGGAGIVILELYA